MVVGNRDRLGMKVQDARAEGADHEVVPLEGLVRRWGHVVLADDRGEVVDVEAVGVVAPVPTDDIQRVVVVCIGVDRMSRALMRTSKSPDSS